jgi:hypothetical protein
MSDARKTTVQQARNACRRHDWADATALFLQADREEALDLRDLEALVWSAGIPRIIRAAHAPAREANNRPSAAAIVTFRIPSWRID